jgi:hypothetical protein
VCELPASGRTSHRTSKEILLLATSCRSDLGTIHLPIQSEGGRDFFSSEKRKEDTAKYSEASLILISFIRLDGHNTEMSKPY